MDRNRMADSAGIRWRNESESSGGMRRNTQLTDSEWQPIYKEYDGGRIKTNQHWGEM